MTQLFFKHNKGIGLNNSYTPRQHPFDFYDKYQKRIQNLQKDEHILFYYNLNKEIREEELKALNLLDFELTMSTANSRYHYLNEVLKKLISIHKRVVLCNKSRNQPVDLRKEPYFKQDKYFPFYEFITNSIYQCFKHIIKRYNELLSQENHNYMRGVVEPRKRTTSFKWIREIPDEILEDAYKIRLINKGFIHQEAHFLTFKSLFTGVTINETIEWSGTLSSLHYFIQSLFKPNARGQTVIFNPNNTHWTVTSEFFTYSNGKPVPNLKGQKKPKQTDCRQIDLFIDDLLSTF